MSNRTYQFGLRFLVISGFLVAISFALPEAFSDLAPHPTPTPTATSRALTNQLGAEQLTVKRVVDGDTIVAERNGINVTIRLIGVNTPETVDPRKGVECYGPEASQFVKTLLTDKTVTAVPDATQQDLDRYGRLLRYIYTSEAASVNEVLVRQGYAFEYTYDRPYVLQAAFKQAQVQAKAERVGLWGACSATSPGVDPADEGL